MLHTVMLAETHGSLPAGQCPNSPFLGDAVGLAAIASHGNGMKEDLSALLLSGGLCASCKSLQPGEELPRQSFAPKYTLSIPRGRFKGGFCTSEVSTGSWLSTAEEGDVGWGQGPLASLSSAVFPSKSSRSISGI